MAKQNARSRKRKPNSKDSDAYWIQNVKMLKMIQDRKLPLSFGENDSVRDYVLTLDPKGRPMKAETFEDVQLLHQELGNKLKHHDLLSRCDELGPHSVPIQIDLWKNKSTKNHYALTNSTFLKLSETNISLDPNVDLKNAYYK